MKTSSKTHYKQVLEQREAVRHLLTDLMGMSEQEYFQAEFTCGLRLIDCYFAPFSGVERVKKRLREHTHIGYWPFFRNLRADWECRFWHAARMPYEDILVYFGQHHASDFLRFHWREAMRCLVVDGFVHERFRHFLILKEKALTI